MADDTARAAPTATRRRCGSADLGLDLGIVACDGISSSSNTSTISAGSRGGSRGGSDWSHRSPAIGTRSIAAVATVVKVGMVAIAVVASTRTRRRRRRPSPREGLEGRGRALEVHLQCFTRSVKTDNDVRIRHCETLEITSERSGRVDHKRVRRVVEHALCCFAQANVGL
jgi:hypothetical protein